MPSCWGITLGIDKAKGEYIEQMTEPYGWPDIDEENLRTRARAFETKASEILWVRDSWERQRTSIFDGGVWSGSAASAGNSAIRQTLGQMSSTQTHLEKALAWYDLIACVVVRGPVWWSGRYAAWVGGS